MLVHLQKAPVSLSDTDLSCNIINVHTKWKDVLPKASFNMGSLVSSSSSSSSIRGEWENLRGTEQRLKQRRLDKMLSGCRQSLTSGCWRMAAAAPWWPTEWWRREDARRHRRPTGPSSPVEETQTQYSDTFCALTRTTQSVGGKKDNNRPSGRRPTWIPWWSRRWRWWKLWTLTLISLSNMWPEQAQAHCLEHRAERTHPLCSTTITDPAHSVCKIPIIYYL